MKDYYKILNVNREDTIQTIKKSYLSLALRHHPDKNNGLDSEFKEILEAYNGIINSYKIGKFYEGSITFNENELAMYSLDYFYNLRILNIKITFKLLKEYCKKHHLTPFNVNCVNCIFMIFSRVSPERLIEKLCDLKIEFTQTESKDDLINKFLFTKINQNKIQ